MYYGITTVIPVVQNDYGYSLAFNLTDSQGNVVNLTNATVKFKAQLVGNPSVSFDNSCTITNAAQGQITYQVQQTDFTIVGTYNAQIWVNYSSGAEIITFDGIQVTVSTEIPS